MPNITRRSLGLSAASLLVASTLPRLVLAAGASTDFVLGMSTTPTTIDPHEYSSAPNNAVSRHIFDSLINRGGSAENKPQLATAWKVVDDTHWQFTLRKGVKFHDGSDFTSADVVASLLRARDKPSASFASYTRNIANVTAPDPLTVVVETKVADPMILNSLSRIRIIKADCAKAAVADFDSGKCAIGTGPYKFEAYTPGDRLKLTRNDDYFDGPSHWTKVTLRFLPDDGARLASLLAGESDMIETLPADGTAKVEADPKLKVIRGQSTRLVYLGMDVSHDVAPGITDKAGKPLKKNPLKDERVRRALLMSINRPAIVDRVMEKNGTVADQFVAKGYLGHSDKVKAVKYNPKQAKKLLAEAGYPDGFKMTIYGPQGRYVKDSEVLQAVGQMFTRIGIETKVEVMPWSMYSTKMDEGNFPVFLASWGVNTGEVSNPAVALVETNDAKKGTGRYNSGGISDPKIDALLDKATATLDEDQRRPLLEQVSEETFNKLWLLPMHYENVVDGAKADIDYTPRGDKYTLVYDVKPAK